MEENYYDENLNAQKLCQVYESRFPRVEQYLESEISFVKNQLQGTERILELGAGYGRIMKALAPYCEAIVGIDISEDNVAFGKEYLREVPNARLSVMDVHKLCVKDSFDVILCLQNGLSAMKIQPVEYYINIWMDFLTENGKVFISSYSPNFWEHRVAWFQEQAEKGLLGEIDVEKTGDGVIVCKDGFRATTHSPEELDRIGGTSGYAHKVMEVDQSSVFLILSKTG